MCLTCRSKSLPEKDVVESITEWFPRLHSLVVGPGLGRDPVILECVKKIVMVAKIMQKNLIIDAVSGYLGLIFFFFLIMITLSRMGFI